MQGWYQRKDKRQPAEFTASVSGTNLHRSQDKQALPTRQRGGVHIKDSHDETKYKEETDFAVKN